MIEAINLSKYYRDGSITIHAVDQASFTIENEEFILIIGRSGSGKSTLLSILGGLTRPDEGQVHLDGINIWSLDDNRLSEIRANMIGFIFQFSGILPTLTAIDNVALPAAFTSKREGIYKQAEDLLKMFGLANKSHSYPAQMSGGELKRVAIARSLINNPTILLADEPTGDLDSETELEIMELFTKINREHKIIVMVTHNPDLAPYADRVFRMDKGRLIESS